MSSEQEEDEEIDNESIPYNLHRVMQSPLMTALGDSSVSSERSHFSLDPPPQDSPSVARDHPLDERQVTIIMLLANVCSLYDPTPRTFVMNVLKFFEKGVLESIQWLADLGLMPQQALPSRTDSKALAAAAYQHNTWHGETEASFLNSTIDFTTGEALNVSRYQREFVELQCIGKGGFGSVHIARKILDGRNYAIKKVAFRNKGFQDPAIRRVLREVRCLARCDHLNVNRYYSAWLEPTWLQMPSESSSSSPGERRSSDSFRLDMYDNRKLLTDIHNAVRSASENEHHSIVHYRHTATAFNDHRTSFSFSESSCELTEEFSFAREEESAETLRMSSSANHAFTYQITLYIQMYLCEHKTLRDWIDTRNQKEAPICSSTNLQFFRQIVAGLAHVHANGIIHRDLKPCNIFMDKGALKIGDFGLSKAISEILDDWDSMPSGATPHSGHTTGIGTAAYSSPEQVAGKSYDHRADSFSLGMILMELFVPFKTQMERYMAMEGIRQDPPKLPSEFPCEFPEIRRMLIQLVDPDPAKRPTAAEMLTFPILNRNELEVEKLREQLHEKNQQLEQQDALIRQLRQQIQELTSTHKNPRANE